MLVLYIVFLVNRSVIGLDIDAESLEIAYANADELEVLFVYVITLFAFFKKKFASSVARLGKRSRQSLFTLVLIDTCSLPCIISLVLICVPFIS